MGAQQTKIASLKQNITVVDFAIAFAIGRVSLARENEAGGRRSIFSMLKYRTSFCFWL